MFIFYIIDMIMQKKYRYAPAAHRQHYSYNIGGENMERSEMPVGFAMALAQNPEAMQKFATLSEDKKQEIIAGTHSVNSKKEMQQYVKSKLS